MRLGETHPRHSGVTVVTGLFDPGDSKICVFPDVQKGGRMNSRLRIFLRDERAQDLIEYSLLIAFIAFAVAGLAGSMGASIFGITSVSNSQISAANTMVS